MNPFMWYRHYDKGDEMYICTYSAQCMEVTDRPRLILRDIKF